MNLSDCLTQNDLLAGAETYEAQREAFELALGQPMKRKHHPECCKYWSIEKCPCQRPDFNPRIHDTYPRNPNPPARELDLHSDYGD